MLKQSHFLTYWRAADAALQARRWPSLPMGRASMYWLLQFSPELAVEAEMLRGVFAPRTLH